MNNSNTLPIVLLASTAMICLLVVYAIDQRIPVTLSNGIVTARFN